MRVALLHYWLTTMRGGEAVFREFCRLFPDGEVFTHVYRPDRIDPAIRALPVRETMIARLPGARRHCQPYLPLMPRALRRLKLDDYDLIVSSESGPAKGVRKRPGAVHLCYCHTPMRYLWDMYDDYYRAAGPAGRLAMRLFGGRLRRHDLQSAKGVDHFIANSRFVADRIRRVYDRDAEVIPPPVHVERFARADGAPPPARADYLFVGQLIPYKRPDVAVAACRRLGRGLTVVGEGPMRKDLETMAKGARRIRFLGRVDDAELPGLYANARAVLFPGVEDFGLVPVEAMASGTPVVALGAGGALETVVANQTGVFFEDAEKHAAGALVAAMRVLEARSWDEAALRRHAARFDVAHFHTRFKASVRRHLPRATFPDDTV